MYAQPSKIEATANTVEADTCTLQTHERPRVCILGTDISRMCSGIESVLKKGACEGGWGAGREWTACQMAAESRTELCVTVHCTGIRYRAMHPSDYSGARPCVYVA